MQTTAAVHPSADIAKVTSCLTEIRIAPARGPPAWDDAPEPLPDCDLLGQPEPDFEFDQRIAW